MKITRYLVSFLLFNIAVAAVPLAIQLLFPRKGYLMPGFWIVFAMFAAVNIVFHITATWGAVIGNKASVRAFVGGTSVKFLLWIVFIFFYLRKFEVNSTVFLLNFFYLYLSNSVFEISSLIRNLRNQNLR